MPSKKKGYGKKKALTPFISLTTKRAAEKEAKDFRDRFGYKAVVRPNKNKIYKKKYPYTVYTQ